MQSIFLKNIAKQFSLGVLLYKSYYKPTGYFSKIIKRGPINYYLDRRSCLEMEAAVYNLPDLKERKEKYYTDIYFLSGKRYWYQTCFCAYSLAIHSEINLRSVIFDDGTLELQYTSEFKRILPNSKIVSYQESEELINKFLPKEKFPFLRERRLNYPHIRKLTDIHIGTCGWKLVLDSDMLFFRNPNFVLDWLESPERPLYIQDVTNSYGYSNDLMYSLANDQIPQKLNVGMLGLKSEEIDWEKIEYWCKKMIEAEGTSYYQEQAIVAMMLSGRECDIAPLSDYIVMPEPEEVINLTAVMHHYVADSKPWYFRYGWKHIIQ